jgi:hypothetical protein
MSPSEYSELVSFLSKKFDGIDRRFNALGGEVRKNGVSIDELRHELQIVAEGVTTNGHRIDRNAEAIAQNGERIDRNAVLIARNAEGIARNAERIDRNGERIARLETFLKVG